MARQSAGLFMVNKKIVPLVFYYRHMLGLGAETLAQVRSKLYIDFFPPYFYGDVFKVTLFAVFTHKHRVIALMSF